MIRKDALLAEKDFKIRALTQEVAYYRRIRYGKVSEALTGEQRSLFDETVDMDVAAIEAELKTSSPRRARNTSIPAANRRRRNCRASSIITNPHPANAANAAPAWSRSAKTLASSLTSNRPASSCTAISARSMRAVPARR